MLNDGNAVVSEDLPYGTEVTLSETAAPEIAGATWTGATFDQSTFTIGDETTLGVTLTNTIERDLGSFSIDKTLTGTGAHLVPDDTAFTVEYSYPEGPGFEAGSGTVEVGADGEPVVVDGIPADAVVTLTEVPPADIEGGTWQPAQFTDGNIVTIAKDETAEVALVNTIDLNSGAFSVVKAIDGDGASLVPDDATFTVEYSFPAANGYDEGSGTLEVPADGTPATSTAIPFGAEVSLMESRPDAVEGATWTDAQFSAASVTIGDGTTTEVTLTNTIVVDVADDPGPPDADPDPGPAPAPDGDLSETGMDSALGTAGLVAAALLSVGAAFALVARQIRRRAG